MLALFNFSGGEILLIVGLVLILFGAERLPGLARGMRKGIDEFLRATRDVIEEMGNSTFAAGQSIGGIYGKRAIEALAPDNQAAELYNPEVLRRGRKDGGFRTIWYQLHRAVSGFVNWLTHNCGCDEALSSQPAYLKKPSPCGIKLQ